MSEQKKGWRERIGGWISGRQGSITTEEALSQTGLDIIKTRTFEERLVEYNKFTGYVQDMALRQKDGNPIPDSEKWTPEDRVKFLYLSTNGLMAKLHGVSIPWGTGGEQGYYTAATFGWSTAYTITLTMIQAVQYLLDQDKVNEKAKKDATEKGDTSTEITVPTPDSKPKAKKSFEEMNPTWKPKVDKIALIESLEYYFYKYFVQYALKVSYISWFGRDIAPTKVAMISNIPQMGGGKVVPQGYEQYQETAK